MILCNNQSKIKDKLGNLISLGELRVFLCYIISTIYQLTNCAFNQNNDCSELS